MVMVVKPILVSVCTARKNKAIKADADTVATPLISWHGENEQAQNDFVGNVVLSSKCRL